VAWTGRILNGLCSDDDLSVDVDSNRLSAELLLDWYEDWVIMERERMRQRVLHALDEVVGQLAGRGEYHRAIDAGLCAVQLEPIRETSHMGIISAHLAEGNRYEACRQYSIYRDLLQRELGVSPSLRLISLLADAGCDPRSNWPVTTTLPDRHMLGVSQR
jgi:DNA-binding SARP family transcriptional activator